MNRLVIWSTLAKGVVLESIRRKDLYVLAILAFLVIAGAGMVGFFGVKGIEVFAKDLGFGVISLFSTLLCIMVSARQLPEEIKNRTLYPMLARPITRLDFVIGKFLGSFLVSALAFLILMAVGCGAMLYFKIALGTIVLQYIVLKLFGFFMLSALTLGLSQFTTPAANVTFCLLLTLGGATISRALLLAHDTLSPAAKFVATAVYYILPHSDLFDLGKKVAYGWGPIPMWVIGALAVYAALYAFAMLAIGWLKFDKQAV